jgi:hypothetical protein
MLAEISPVEDVSETPSGFKNVVTSYSLHVLRLFLQDAMSKRNSCQAILKIVIEIVYYHTHFIKILNLSLLVSAKDRKRTKTFKKSFGFALLCIKEESSKNEAAQSEETQIRFVSIFNA